MSPEDHVQEFARCLRTGEYDWITRQFCYPLPVFVDRSTRIAADAAEAQGMLAGLMATIRAGGFDDVAPRMVSVELPRGNRFRMWCDWFGAGPAGTHLLFKTVCYHRGTHDEHQTEMVRIENRDWRRRAARPGG